MTNEHPERLDLILNAAIRDYSNPEPRAGLEQRIVRHVQTTPRRRPPWRFAWALVVAAIVVAAVLIALSARLVSPPVLALLPPPVPQAAAASSPIPASPPKPRTSGHRSPRRGKDPGPLPLTAEERALLRLVQEQPEKALAVLSQPAELEALTIEPLEIEKLQ
jgi:hypothetical protein